MSRNPSPAATRPPANVPANVLADVPADAPAATETPANGWGSIQVLDPAKWSPAPAPISDAFRKLTDSLIETGVLVVNVSEWDAVKVSAFIKELRKCRSILPPRRRMMIKSGAVAGQAALRVTLSTPKDDNAT